VCQLQWKLDIYELNGIRELGFAEAIRELLWGDVMGPLFGTIGSQIDQRIQTKLLKFPN
jgi:hypothetical protein